MKDLLPCPFCGSKAEVEEMSHAPYGEGSQFFVVCQSCNATANNSSVEVDAVDSWNRRHVMCRCGGDVVFETKDWANPLCHACWVDYGEPEFER